MAPLPPRRTNRGQAFPRTRDVPPEGTPLMKVGVTDELIPEWLPADPMRDAARRYGVTCDKVVRLLTRVMTTLDEMLEEKDLSPSIRVAACKVMLDALDRARKVVGYDDRGGTDDESARARLSRALALLRDQID